MALNKVDIPFNKDQATIGMGKDAISALEGLFDIMEREGVAEEERDAWLAGQVEDIYKNWSRKYPRKDNA